MAVRKTETSSDNRQRMIYTARCRVIERRLSLADRRRSGVLQSTSWQISKAAGQTGKTSALSSADESI